MGLRENFHSFFSIPGQKDELKCRSFFDGLQHFKRGHVQTTWTIRGEVGGQKTTILNDT